MNELRLEFKSSFGVSPTEDIPWVRIDTGNGECEMYPEDALNQFSYKGKLFKYDYIEWLEEQVINLRNQL